MKTSVILIILIIFNTTALVAEPLAQFIKGLNTWILIVAESILIIGYYINTIIKNIRKATKIDFNNLKLFVTKAN